MVPFLALRTAVRRSLPPGCKRLLSSLVRPDNRFFRVTEEIREAVNAKRPVVALETTIYTHGFPYPENVALATELEAVVRANGGVPATIGVLDGIARVGLELEELERLTSASARAVKLSRRDLGYICGKSMVDKSLHGGTTIAGTMVLAHLAGIKVFATGGLGGVHRGAESSMDVSADLTELGRTPVAVVCSGCKAFLDIQRTLEYLETQGVGVATFADERDGKIDFPAFWSRDSGVPSPSIVKNAKEAAAVIYAQNMLQLKSGLLFANPIPAEAEIAKTEVESIITEAIREADLAGASGKDNTPFILSKIKELTGGKSVIANRALVTNNVRMGTLVARELSQLEANEFTSAATESTYTIPVQRSGGIQGSRGSRASTDIVVAGALAIDYSCDFEPLGVSPSVLPVLHTSNPCNIKQTLGGVGHNIAKAADYLGASALLCSKIADDLPGKVALQQLREDGLDTSGIETIPASTNISNTAQYVAVNDARRDLFVAMADMKMFETGSVPTLTQLDIRHAKWFVVDGNWSDPISIFSSLRDARSTGAKTAFEPVSTAKAARLLTWNQPDRQEPHQTKREKQEGPILPVFPDHIFDLMTPNHLELAALHVQARETGLLERRDWWQVIDGLGIPSSGARPRLADLSSADLVDQGIPQQSIQLLPFVPTILTKLGPKGVLVTELLHRNDGRLANADTAPYILSRTRGAGADSNCVGGVYMRLFPPAEVLDESQVVSVNGVGDTFLGALLAAQAKTGRRIDELVLFAQKAAVLTLKSKEAVSRELRNLQKELDRLA